MCIFFTFWPSKMHASPTGVVSSFFSPLAASPSVDIATPSCHVVLPLHEAKLSLLALLYLSVTLSPVVSPLKPKSNH
jgi:hypothetical protein